MRTNLSTLSLLLALVAPLACGRSAEPPPAPAASGDPAPDLQERAEELARSVLIVDTHVDAPYRQSESVADVSISAPDRDFDLPRALEGGLDAPFMSIYIPASYQHSGGAKELADELIDWVEALAASAPDKLAIATSPKDLTDHFAAGKVSLPMGMENGAGIEDDLANLQHFFDRGIRYVTLTHSENNLICDSSYAEERTWEGLSPFGREVVAEMNRLGMMIDISHVSDDAAFQVLELTRAPVIASHSSCRAFTPGWERNISDELIVALAENGGVVQINFGSAFLTQAANEQSKSYYGGIAELVEGQGLDPESAEVEAFKEGFWEQSPPIYATVGDVVDHIDHVVELVGVEHVGLGSDFDGVGDSLPVGLKDVSQYPNLIRALLERGYSEGDVAKICGGNLLRVWRQAEKVAEELQGEAATAD